MKRPLVLIMGFLFLFFAYLQLNDNDSLLWVVVYLIPSILSFLSFKNHNYKFNSHLSLVYLLFALIIFFTNSETTIMHIFDEKTNESLGLTLCSLWIFMLNRL